MINSEFSGTSHNCLLCIENPWVPICLDSVYLSHSSGNGNTVYTINYTGSAQNATFVSIHNLTVSGFGESTVYYVNGNVASTSILYDACGIATPTPSTIPAMTPPPTPTPSATISSDFLASSDLIQTAKMSRTAPLQPSHALTMSKSPEISDSLIVTVRCEIAIPIEI
jgi:hypothetical protein